MASGLFARYGLTVELVAPARHGGTRFRAVGDGPEFALASVYGRLAALARPDAGPAERFVAAVHQRSPLAAFVPADSQLREPWHLSGRRVAASTLPWFDHEYRSGLLVLGLRPPVVVQPHPSGERPSLAEGEVDAIGSWAESIAPMRRRAGIAVRAIPFGPAVYTTGVVASDRVAPELAARMVAALSDAYLAQRERPRVGLGELCRRFPTVRAVDALEEWAVLDGYVFAEPAPLAMDADRWRSTIDHAARTHGFPRRPLGEVCRDEALARSDGRVPARSA